MSNYTPVVIKDQKMPKWLIALLIIIAVVVVSLCVKPAYYAYLKHSDEKWNVKAYPAPRNLEVELVDDRAQIDNKDGKGVYVSFRKKDGEHDELVESYLDPQCPYCEQLENKSLGDIKNRISSGHLDYHVHLVTYMDKNRSNTTSGVVSSAIYTLAANKEAGAAWSLYNAWWANKTNEHYENDPNPDAVIEDISLDEIADAAQKAGASEKSVQEIRDGSNEVYAKAYSTYNMEVMRKRGGTVSTPMVFVNDTLLANAIQQWYPKIMWKQ